MTVTQRLLVLYARLSERPHPEPRQLEEMEAWVRTQRREPYWVKDVGTAPPGLRLGWQEVLTLVRAGKVAILVVWRLDRLGLTARELLTLFDELHRHRVLLKCLTEDFELASPAGHVVPRVLAALAALDAEVRSERIAAGQRRARQLGQRWGGSRPGRRWRVSPEREAEVLQLAGEGKCAAQIARAVGLARSTVYTLLCRHGQRPQARPRRRRPRRRR